jgi:signal peptidase II
MSEGAKIADRKPDRPLSPLGISVIGVTIAIDQITKAWAERALEYGQPIDLLPVLSLYRVHNDGIAFSMLRDVGEVGLFALALGVVALIFILWQKSEDGGHIAAIGYALIVGGAFGNIADRVSYGHVVDFLLVHIGDQPLFVFNLADAALTIGPILLILIIMSPAQRAARRVRYRAARAERAAREANSKE